MTISTILAYIDPGAGAILLQVVLGSIVGVAIFFRQSVGRVFGFLRRGRTTAPTHTDEASRS